jgi:DNA-binding MarR family transcriptional regulator
MRTLAGEVAEQSRVTLGDFDVLAQLAVAGGQLRMTDLAARAFSSRSGMTRRVDRLVEVGLVQRESDGSDGRSVIVGLTMDGVAHLEEALPVLTRGIATHFSEPLDDDELAVLESALA